MPMQDWSDKIIIVDLQSDPDFTDDLAALQDRIEGEPRDVVLNFSGVKFLNSSNISDRKVITNYAYFIAYFSF